MIYRSLPSSNYKPSVCSWKTHHHGGIILYKTIILDAVYWCMISVAVYILRHNVYWSLLWWTRSSRAMSGSIKTWSVPSGLVARNSWTAHPGQVEADYKTQSLQYSPLTLPPVPPHSRQDEARAAAVLGAPPPRRRPALLQPRAPAPPPDLAPAQGPGTEAGTQRPQAGLQAQTRQIQAPRQVQVRLEYIEDIEL